MNYEIIEAVTHEAEANITRPRFDKTKDLKWFISNLS